MFQVASSSATGTSSWNGMPHAFEESDDAQEFVLGHATAAGPSPPPRAAAPMATAVPGGQRLAAPARACTSAAAAGSGQGMTLSARSVANRSRNASSVFW